MANLQDYFFEQLVTEADLDGLQANLEAADHQLMTDQGYVGIVSGFTVSEHLPVQDLSVDIAGPGVAYDQEGHRIYLSTSVNLDVSVDSNASPTAVVTPGNEKWISIFVQFEREASELRFDGNGLPVYFRQDESLSFVVVQGAESGAGTAVRPALLADALLIGDVLLTNGQTQIMNADIESSDVVSDPDSRFEFIFNLTASSPAQVRVGPLPDAMQAMLSALNTHTNDLGNAHDADAIDFNGGLAVPAGATPPLGQLQSALNVQDAFEGLAIDLSEADAIDNSGAFRVGYHNIVTAAAMTVQDALDGLIAVAAEVEHEGYLGPFVDEVVLATTDEQELQDYPLPNNCSFTVRVWGSINSTSTVDDWHSFELVRVGARTGGTTVVHATALVQQNVDTTGSTVFVEVEESVGGVRVYAETLSAPASLRAVVHSEVIVARR